MLVFDAETLPRMQPPKARFQFFEHAAVDRKTAAVQRSFGKLKIHKSPIGAPVARPSGSVKG